ncbi:Broad specificity phosphatase PhoE [Catalinimonas alkaloidigena]|uniref:Broad specificity phosphatase PhoE n=1 Tax=Catalinimonas alkaloidigena TaxID=1075417 RepID=A0A1G9RFW1_9BACT|nr:histidine phosphatase family protein [Catalinimonas alkaloidigena]SDM22114.1 Broad specificity phosphatase PhoE [Catalinimonas alkaloidigena]
MRITLIRHGQPLIERPAWAPYAEAHRYHYAYDEVAVKKHDVAHFASLAEEADRVYCSALRRSRETAKMIFGDACEIIADPTFNELKTSLMPHIPLVRLPVRVWQTGGRILWLLGKQAKDHEAFRMARLRARRATGLLIQEAQTHGLAVLVGHGMMNRFIAWRLRRQGWRKVQDEGSGYLSRIILEKM